MWDLEKLTRTGFMSLSDIQDPPGMEESAVFAAHQRLFPSQSRVGLLHFQSPGKLIYIERERLRYKQGFGVFCQGEGKKKRTMKEPDEEERWVCIGLADMTLQWDQSWDSPERQSKHAKKMMSKNLRVEKQLNTLQIDSRDVKIEHYLA